MKTKKTPFFVKLKIAIFNFDRYQSFAEEKIGWSIKYFIKLIALFTIVISIVSLISFNHLLGRGKEILINEVPEFKFENDVLILEGEENEIIKSDKEGYYSLIISSQKESLSEVESTGHQTAIAFLKDKISFKGTDEIERSISYSSISQRYDLKNMNKEVLLQFMNNKVIYVVVFVVSYIYFYLTYFVSILVDILLLSLVGFLISRIINVRFKYKVIFNMSVYSLTLSILLYLIYIVINTFTGFTIRYFELAYNVIGYIYLITAMFMIKSDLIKQQIELAKVIEEQKKVREELEEQEEEKKEEEKEEDKKEEKEDNKETKSKDEAEGEPNPA